MTPEMRSGVPSPPRRWASLEWRLPLLMSGVLAAVLVAAVGLTYATLVRDTLNGYQDRLERSARQVAQISAAGVRTGRARYLAVARDTALRRALREAESGPTPRALDPAAREVLERLVIPADSGMPTELWTADGRRLGFVGPDLRGGVVPAPDGDGLAIPRPGLESLRPGEPLQLGWLYADGEHARFWLVITVADDDGRTLGHIVRQRRVGGNPDIERALHELTGAAVTGYYRNPAGDVWGLLSGRAAAASVRDASGRWMRPAVGEMLHAEQAVEGTPFTLVFEVPRAQLLDGPRGALLSLSVVGVVLLGVGAALSWSVSRRITGPLRAVTAAAEALGRGDLSARAPVTGADEVTRLAQSFNHMAAEVATTRAVIEAQSAEARAAAAELAHSNTELREARQLADDASRAKSDFLAVMSHELRTPLNAIGGYAELMAMELRGPITEAQRRDLERIRVSQQHLLGLVSAVLDMHRIERGQLAYDLAPVALAPFLAGLDALVAPQAAAKTLGLVCEPCPASLAVVADREKLRQIVLNLLSNAIRCTPAGGTVTLEAAVRDAATVEVRVRDTGIGIPEDRQAQIFEPFVQLDRSLTQTREGVGLGLAISRDLARGMGGELAVRSRVGEGSVFTLTLPRASAEVDDALITSGEVAAARPG